MYSLNSLRFSPAIQVNESMYVRVKYKRTMEKETIMHFLAKEIFQNTILKTSKS